MTDTDVLQVHLVVNHDIVDTYYHKCFLVLPVVTIKGKGTETLDKSHMIFPVPLAYVVELSYREPFLMLEVPFAELACQLFPGSDETWREGSVPSFGTIG